MTRSQQTRRSERGFSLLEVMVAVAVLGIALLSLTALRSSGLMTSAEARNVRFARALAHQVLSEIQAGMHKAYDMRNQELTKDEERMKGFSYKILIGETEIQEEESLVAENRAYAHDATDRDQKSWERQQWLNERSRTQRARSQGVLVDDLENEELEVDETPDEDTFEEIAIFVYYPSFRETEDDESFGIFRLRSRTSTLALSGLTNEQAQDRQSSLSTDTGSSGSDGGASK